MSSRIPLNPGGLVPLEVEYEIQIEDLVEAALLHSTAFSPAGRRIQNGLMLGGSATILLLGVMSGGYLLAYGLLGALLFAGFQKFLVPQIQREQARALYNEGRNRGLVGRHKVIVTESEIIDANPYMEMRARWSGVERILVSEKYVHVYLNAVRAIVIPRDAFSSESALAEFVRTAQSLQAAALGPTAPPPALPR